MIPKLLHFIWVGDDAKRPDNCIDSWRTLHPDWDIMVWGNTELETLDWTCGQHMVAMYPRELNGVADMMRWEILRAHGGIVLDADSVALRPLDDALLDCEAFACWENEIARPGLIAAGYFGCEPGNAFVAQIVADIAAEPSVTHDMAWKTVGPMRLTESYRRYGYSPLRIYPSHYFIPRHFTGLQYAGKDPVYAHQLWGSTCRGYDALHTLDVDANTALVVGPAKSLASSLPAAAKAERRGGQRLAISDVIADVDRNDVFANLCRGKRVLLVQGDGPLQDALAPGCAQLDRIDPHAMLVPNGGYDVVLAPDALERVPNVADFLARLAAIDAATFLIAASDASRGTAARFDYAEDTQTFVEYGDPERTAWYTPYTLANTIAKYGALTIEQLWYFDRGAILALLSKPALALSA